MSDGLAAIGTELQRSGGIVIGEVTNFGGPSFSADTADLTNHGSGLYEVQTITLSGATTGNFTLTFEGQTTANIAYNASASAVETALEALSTIDDVVVEGTLSGGMTVEFRGNHALEDVNLLTGDDTGTDGTLSINETTAGQPPYEEVIPTVLRTGELPLDINFDPDGQEHQNMLKRYNDKASDTYTLVFPDNTQWSFTAFVTGFDVTSNHTDKLEASVTLKITGQPTLDLSNATV